MTAERHMHAVTGEVAEPTIEGLLAENASLEAALRQLEIDHRTSLAKITNLKRDREAEAKKSQLWPIAERLLVIWCRATGHVRKGTDKPTMQLSYKRFDFVEPYIRDLAAGDDAIAEPQLFATDGPPVGPFEECVAAIIGRATYHFSIERENGTTRKFDEWERIFENDGEFNESKSRRPRDWRARFAELDPGPIAGGPRSA